VVLGSLASAEAVLSEDEKEIGGGVIDMGGGTTDLLLYADGGIAHASTIPAGGNNVTNDVAAGLRTPVAEADRLKRNYGCALGRMIADEEEIEVPGVGGHEPRKVPRRVLGDIVEPRIEELFSEVRRRMEESGLIDQLSAGMVLTGGAVQMEGIVAAAEEILGMPVRLGVPVGVKGIVQLILGPQWATGVGLVHYGAQRLAEARHYSTEEAPAAARSEEAARAKSNGSLGRGVLGWLRAAF
jgi:cell division protein FtsA